jgi:hypothetical protein
MYRWVQKCGERAKCVSEDNARSVASKRITKIRKDYTVSPIVRYCKVPTPKHWIMASNDDKYINTKDLQHFHHCIKESQYPCNVNT